MLFVQWGLHIDHKELPQSKTGRAFWRKKKKNTVGAVAAVILMFPLKVQLTCMQLLCSGSSSPVLCASSAVLRKRRSKNTYRASSTKRPCGTLAPSSQTKQSSSCRYVHSPVLARLFRVFSASLLGYLGFPGLSGSERGYEITNIQPPAWLAHITTRQHIA